MFNPIFQDQILREPWIPLQPSPPDVQIVHLFGFDVLSQIVSACAANSRCVNLTGRGAIARMPWEIPAKRPSAAPCAPARSTWRIARRHAKRIGRARRELAGKCWEKTKGEKRVCRGHSHHSHGFPGAFFLVINLPCNSGFLNL